MIDASLDSAYKELDEQSSELKALIGDEARQREASVREIKDQTRKAALRNFAFLAFGAFVTAL